MRRTELSRYVVTGLVVTGCYVAFYPLLSHLGMSALWANTLAYGLAILLQYVLHATYTFGVSPGRQGQWRRFCIVIALGFAISTLVTNGLAPRLGISDLAAALLVAVLIPVVNWVLFRNWVFRGLEGK